MTDVNYIPISSLYVDGSVSDTAYIPVSDGTYAFAIRVGDLKSLIAQGVFPSVTGADNGKYLRVSNGQWALSEADVNAGLRTLETRLFSGVALTASTAAGMTDTSRIYIYTGSESGYTRGNWYYYNGTAWVSGGAYVDLAVVTDSTLSMSGIPADAAAAGVLQRALMIASNPGYVTGWSQGYIRADGSIGTWNQACVSGYVSFGDADKVSLSIASGWTFVIGEYTGSTSGTFLGRVVENVTRFDLENVPGHYYRLQISKSPLATFTPSAVPDELLAYNPVRYTDKTLSMDNKAADAAAVGDAISGLRSAITEETRNLWLWGDQKIVNQNHVKLLVSIPAGTYTLSADLTKNGTGNARIIFWKTPEVTTTANVLAEPYLAANAGRNATTFTISEPAVMLEVRWSVDGASTGTTTWKDVQLEAGSAATAYIPPITAIDALARSQIVNPILLSEETYTGDQTIRLTLQNNRSVLVFACDAMFTRTPGVTDYPRIQFVMTNNRGLERNTTWYMVGRENEYQIKEWRAPAYLWEDKTLTISIRVPSGCTLSIRKLWYRFDSSQDRTGGRGVKFFARAGTCNMVPELSIPALQMAQYHGYDAFTVIPKVSSDGVWFAYHDDTFDLSTTTLRNPDGTTIATDEYNGQYFHNIPFSHLDQYRYGLYGSMFYGTRIMRLETCLEFLSKTGMKLRFSMHPATGINTTEKLTALKRLVQKYGLLQDLTIIVNDIASLFPVFGNDIGGYCFPNALGSNWDGSTKRVDVALTNAQSAKQTYNITVPISCGLWVDSLFDNRSNAEALVGQILDAGFSAGAFAEAHVGIDGVSHNYLWSEDMRWLMSIGVTEFTDGYNTSNGLNW